jgi:hypothetical protein
LARTSAVENDPALIDRIVRLVEGGAPPTEAAASCGVNERTFYGWRSKGRAGREPYAAMEARLTAARGTAITRAVLKVQQLGLGGEVKRRTTRVDLDGSTIIEEEFYPAQLGALTWWLERVAPAIFTPWRRLDGEDDEEPGGGPDGGPGLDPGDAREQLMGQLDRIAARIAAPARAGADRGEPRDDG